MLSLTREQHELLIAEAVAHLGGVPAHLSPGLSRYLVFGIEPGGFLCAVLENNLHEAVMRVTGSPEARFATLQLVTSWLYNHAPGQCWGSKAKRLEWQRAVAALVPQEEVPNA